MTTKKLAYTKRIDFKTTEEQVEKLEQICEVCNLTKAEVYRRLLDLAAIVTSNKTLFLTHRLINEITANDVIITFTHEELESINKYAAEQELPKVEAIRDLVSKGIAYLDSRYGNIDN